MEGSHSTHRQGTPHQHCRPAIGINAVSTDAESDAIADTVQRVAHHDVPVFVAAPIDTPALHRTLQDTAATVLDVSDPDADPVQVFATAGKERGLPGVVVHPAPGSDAAFAYEDSVETFTASDQYVVTGHATDTTAAPSRVGILIASEHSAAVIDQARKEAAPYLDELLLVTDGEDLTDELDTATTQLPVAHVTHSNGSASPLVTALTDVTRQYTHCDAVTLLGADTDTVTSSLPALPALAEPLAAADAALVVGQEMTATPDGGTSRSGQQHSDELRNVSGETDMPQSTPEFTDGPVAFTPAAAQELAPELDRTATRRNLIDTAVRTDLTVRIHDYEPGEDNVSSTSTATRPDNPAPSNQSPAMETPGSPTTPAPASDPPRSAPDSHPQRDPSPSESRAASDRVLDIVYAADADAPDPDIALDTIRGAVADLSASTEITVSDASTSVLEHVVDAHHHGQPVFLATPRERAAHIDAVADTFGLNILPLPTSDPSASMLAKSFRTHLDQHPDSRLIIAPGTLDHEPAAARVVAPSADATRDPAPTRSGDVLIGIPAYNEAAPIADVVSDATQYADEVLVVDDASDDDTATRAAAAGATVIHHETNRGYGGALNTVFAEAARRDPAHLVIVDGDGQHDPSDIPDAVATQEDSEADIVIGSRFETGSETDLPAYRRVGLAVVNTLTNLSMGVIRRESWVNDTQSGFRTYNRRAIRSLHQDDTIGDGMSASTDILYHAHQQDYDLEEIGTTIDYDVEDPSSHNPITHGLTLVANILKTIEHDRPVTSLGVPGFLSAFAGLGFGYWTFSNYIATGDFPLGLAVTSSFFGLAGIFACFTAIILHSLNTHLNDA